MHVLLALCATMLVPVLAAPAEAAPGDPLLKFNGYVPTKQEEESPTSPPPPVRFEGPCGLLVSKTVELYVANYYFRRIDVFPAPTAASVKPNGRLSDLDPDSGPCGMALDNAGNLYVNIYHRSVIRYPVIGPATVLNDDEPTGVAADKPGTVFVNNRTFVSVYDSAGSLTEEVGVGNLIDAYGIAVSEYSGTQGRVYVPDAGTDTVKVFDPAISKDNPVSTITGPGGGVDFTSLKDSAVAIDRVTGYVYVADNLQPAHTEYPEAAIFVFDSSGAYLGRLKYNIIDALPPGLAVDNSLAPSQGRVYVTSGNTEKAFVYVYAPNSQVLTGLPAPDKETPGGGSDSDGGSDASGAPSASFELPGSAQQAPGLATASAPIAVEAGSSKPAKSKRSRQAKRRRRARARHARIRARASKRQHR